MRRSSWAPDQHLVIALPTCPFQNTSKLCEDQFGQNACGNLFPCIRMPSTPSHLVCYLGARTETRAIVGKLDGQVQFAHDPTRRCAYSEGGIQLETIIELKFLNLRVSRAYPLIWIRLNVAFRAIRGNSISVNSTLPPLIYPDFALAQDHTGQNAHRGSDIYIYIYIYNHYWCYYYY